MGGETVFWHLLEVARTHTYTTSKLPAQRISRLSPFSRCDAVPIERPAIWHTLIPSIVYGKGLSAEPFCPYSSSTRTPSYQWAKPNVLPSTQTRLASAPSVVLEYVAKIV